MEDIFGLRTTYLGRTGLSDVRIAISQPFIVQNEDDPPTHADVTEFMLAHGFAKVEKFKIALPEISDVTWYRKKDGILVSDAHPRNFRKDEGTGAIIPVDLMIAVVPKGVSRILPDPDTIWKSAPNADPCAH